MANRPGKYAHITDRLPKLPTVSPERRDVVEALKAEILSPGKAGEAYVALPTRRELFEALNDSVDLLVALEKRACGVARNAATFARAYAEVREIKENLVSHLADVQVLLETYESLMVEQMQAENVASLRLTDGKSVSTYQEPYPSVVDKEAYRVWCLKNGFEHDMHLWPSRTAALVKEMLLNGDAEPPGIEVYSKTMVRLNA